MMVLLADRHRPAVSGLIVVVSILTGGPVTTNGQPDSALVGTHVAAFALAGSPGAACARRGRATTPPW